MDEVKQNPLVVLGSLPRQKLESTSSRLHCTSQYIGMTGRDLNTRVKEQKRDVRPGVITKYIIYLVVGLRRYAVYSIMYWGAHRDPQWAQRVKMLGRDLSQMKSGRTPEVAVAEEERELDVWLDCHRLDCLL